MTGVPAPWPVTDPSRAPVEGRDRVVAVVCAAFDADTDDAVLAVRARLGPLGVVQPARPPHRPHLTLAAARLHPARLPEFVLQVTALAAGRAPVSEPLPTVGRFGRAGALWLGPAGTRGSPALRALHADVDAALTRAGWERAFGARSAPAGWVPHCSLATRLHPARLREVQAALAAGYRPVEAVVAGLAVVLVGGSGDVALAPFTGP